MKRLLKIAQALGFSITLLGTVTGAATILLHYLGSGPIRPVHRGVLLIAIFLIFIGLLLLAFCYAWRWERRATHTAAMSTSIDAVPADDTDRTDAVIVDSPTWFDPRLAMLQQRRFERINDPSRRIDDCSNEVQPR